MQPSRSTRNQNPMYTGKQQAAQKNSTSVGTSSSTSPSTPATSPGLRTQGVTSQSRTGVKQSTQIIYEQLSAPIITSVGREFLIEWKRQRKVYESKVKERKDDYKEDVHALSIKNSVEPRLKKQLARLIFKKDEKDITDKDILEHVNGVIKKEGKSKNLDLDSLFKERLKMDLSIGDVGQRVLYLWIKFDEICEEEGLEEYFTGDNVKYKCKFLLGGVRPMQLRTRLESVVKYDSSHAKCKIDDIELYELILAEAKEQDKHHAPISSNTKKLNIPKKGNSSPTAATLEQRGPSAGCLKCKSKQHWLSTCPDVSSEEKTKLLEEHRVKVAGKRRGNKKLVSREKKDPTTMARLNDMVVVPYEADTGTKITTVSRDVITELQSKGVDCFIEKIKAVQVELPIKGVTTVIEYTAYISIEIHTMAGPVLIPPRRVDILENGHWEVLLGDDILKSLGIDVEAQLALVAEKDRLVGEGEQSMEVEEEEVQLGKNDEKEIEEAVQNMIQRANDNGCPEHALMKMKEIIKSKMNVWRVKLCGDPPAKVVPLKLQLKDGAAPVRAAVRSYSPIQEQYLKEFLDELELYGIIQKVQHSTWGSAAVVVQKPNGKEFRSTWDLKKVNSQLVPKMGPLPLLETKRAKVNRSKVYQEFDFNNGFWQLPLDIRSRDICTLVTPWGLYQTDRVLQGLTDSPGHFQGVMETCFKDVEGLLIWIDDMLNHAETVDELVNNFEKIMTACEKFGLKLNPKKCCIYTEQALWCGKLYSSEGVTHDPDRLSTLSNMDIPKTVGDLQQFVCATNWLRESLPDYARVSEPLRVAMNRKLKGGKRTKRAAVKMDIELDDKELRAFEDTKKLVAQAITLAHPEPEAEVSVFTDASEDGWGVFVTQVKKWQNDVNVYEMEHEPLACLGGTFKGASLNWSIIEKEAFPIMIACQRLNYLLLRPNGFHLYCDHKNLMYMFSPGATVKKHTSAKLIRWSLRLSPFRYQIHHIEGENNVWGDMLSRWAQPKLKTTTIKAIRRSKRVIEQKQDKQKLEQLPEQNMEQRDNVKDQEMRPSSSVVGQVATPHLRPLQDAFVWPTVIEVALRQKQYLKKFQEPVELTKVDRDGGVLYLHKDRIWIPDTALDLVYRIMVVAHYGSQCHRGKDPMLTAIRQRFYWDKLDQSVEKFLKMCAICKHVKGPKIIMRPNGATLRASKRNQVVHYDYVYIGESLDGPKYLLVMKDDLSHYVWLCVCDTTDARTSAHHLCAWIAAFGIPQVIVSDTASHFKNRLLEEITRRMDIHQDFVVAYSPWVNGSVERVMRDIIQLLRALTMEYKMAENEWPYFIPILQHCLNHTQVASLGAHAPVEVFTGLEAQSNLDVLIRDGEVLANAVQLDADMFKAMVSKLRMSLKNVHKDVIDIKLKRQLLNKRKQRGQVPINFVVGDYVLWSRKDDQSSERQRKAHVYWRGPFQVMDTLTESAFQIKHLITGRTYAVHASRLKFYADQYLDVTVNLKEHIASQGLLLDVKAILQHRFIRNTNIWELHIQWWGLEDAENSWEPLDGLWKDIPVLVMDYASKVRTDDDFVNYIATLVAKKKLRSA